jgi:hypothetical protein
MITLDLPEDLEKHFWHIVRDNYHGDLQAAVAAFLQLHEKYGWKEQFVRDVESIREEVRRTGGIKERMIEESVKRYRAHKQCSFFQSLGYHLRPLPEQAKHGRSRTSNDTVEALHANEQ